jgi:hypothetical protein
MNLKLLLFQSKSIIMTAVIVRNSGKNRGVSLFLSRCVDTIYHIPKGETCVKINDRMLTPVLSTQVRYVPVFHIDYKAKTIYQRNKEV